MPIIQANVPSAHLATEMGRPNQLQAEYSTDILLPLPGPYTTAQIRRDFEKAVLQLNDFLLLARDTKAYLAAGGKFELNYRPPLITPRTGDVSAYGKTVTPAANVALDRNRAQFAPDLSTLRRTAPSAKARGAMDPQTVLLSRMSAPNEVFRELYDADVLVSSDRLLNNELLEAKTFDAELKTVLKPLLRNRAEVIPEALPPVLQELASQAIAEVRQKHTGFLGKEFAGISSRGTEMLTQWMVAYHQSGRPAIAERFAADTSKSLGFKSRRFIREWAFNRKERLTMVFGTPDLRGPVAAEPVAPQGTYSREDYQAAQTEAITQRRELRRTSLTEADQFGSASLRRNLEKVYYSGAGALDQLTSQASNSLLREQKRATVLSIVRQWSEERELVELEARRATTSSTTIREAIGVDEKLAATHHLLNVTVPVDVKIELYDVNLTWAPRIFNPFFYLRQAIRDVYQRAYDEHLQRYYVPVPTRPPMVWDTFTATTNILMSGEEVATANFSIPLAPSSSEQRADLDNARVTWNQDESFWNDDPDHFTAVLENLRFNGSTITGGVRLETNDGGADFEGTALIEVPILRYAQETVNALAQYELDLADAEQRREALAAQASQYARVKQREFIERHDNLTDIQKIVFEALIRHICLNTLAVQRSYYQEIIARTIDWTSAKIEFESAQLNALEYPDFPPDHFVNSLAVRFFLPIIHTAEEVFFDALEACGTPQVRASVQQARDNIDAERTRLQTDGPDELDRFSTEMVIGKHIEAVMSNHDHRS